MYAKLIGTGHYVPDRIVTNHELADRLDTSAQWIASRTGIHERRYVGTDEPTSVLATEAASRAMQSANVPPSEVDLIVVATCTPDKVFPNVGCMVQHNLGIPNCPAFSVESACSGFIYALTVADNFIKVGSSQCALVIGADAMSSIVDWNDRSTCILFGDGAGAVVLRASETPGILTTELGADGQHKNLLHVPRDAYLTMSGRDVFRHAVEKLGSLGSTAKLKLEQNGSEINWLIPHQANLRIIEAVAKRVDLPIEKVILTLQNHGNTSAASIPIALDVGVADNRVQPGHNLVLQAFGGGFTWGSAIVQF